MNLIGKKINLRYPTPDDIDSITKYAADEDISKFTFIPHPYTRQHAIDFLEMATEDRRTLSSLHCGIAHKETDEIIGMVGLNTINKTHNRAEIGYWLAKPFWGQGFMFDAVNLLTQYSFEKLNLIRLYAHVDPDNIGSWKLLEKAGYEREGLLKKFLCIRDKMYNNYLYAKVK